jgi:ABC-2 type transport system permease protein
MSATMGAAPAFDAQRPSFWRTAVVLWRLTWARTMTPALIAGIIALVLLPMVFAIAFASRGPMSGDAVPFLVGRYDQLVCALATPLIALLLGTSAFNAEAEDGTLVYLVTTTTPRWWIATVRVLFAAVITGGLSALAVWMTGYLASGSYDRGGVTRAFTIAVLYGGATYAAFFTALSLLTRRALVGGLAYVLFWEGILSITFPGINYLSVRQWMLAIADSLAEVSSEQLEVAPSPTVAVVGGAAVVLLSIAISARKLRAPRSGKG